MKFRGPPRLVSAVAIVGSVATVLSLILLYLEYSGRLGAGNAARFLWIDTALSLIMMAEWFVLLVYAESRRAYVAARWIDLLASLPLLLFLRPLRIIRLLRLIRLIRGVAMIRNSVAPLEAALDTALLKSVGIAAAAVILISALLIMDLERNNPLLNSFDDALWWAIVTCTTVGYGDRFPLTNPGRFVSVALMLIGIGLFGTLAATLTSALTASRKSKKDTTNDDLLRELHALRDQIVALERRLPPGLGPASPAPVMLRPAPTDHE